MLIAKYKQNKIKEDTLMFIGLIYMIATRDNQYSDLDFVLLIIFTKVSDFNTIRQRFLQKIQTMKIKHFTELVELIIIVLIYSHFFACIWIMVAQIQRNNNEKGWVDQYGSGNEILGYYDYCVSLYFSVVTMITVGYGDVTPQNSSEFIISIILMLFACGIFAYMLNKIGSVLDDINKIKQKKNSMLFQANKYMLQKNISRRLRYACKEYIEYYFEKSLDDEMQIQEKMLEILSEPLKNSLLLETYHVALRDSPIFKHNFSGSTIEQTVQLINQVGYAPEQVIFNKHDKDDCIYFIDKGEIDIFIAKDQEMETEKHQQQVKVVKTLVKGQAIGIIEFFTGNRRQYSVRSKGFTRLLKIQRQDFLKLLKYHNLDDYEQFCYIKDLLLQQQYGRIWNKCFACDNSKHTIQNCYFVNFLPNRLRIINIYNKNEPQERKEQTRYKIKKYNTLQNLMDMQDWQLEYAEDNVNYIENYQFYGDIHYDDDSDITSSSSSTETTTESSSSEQQMESSKDYNSKLIQIKNNQKNEEQQNKTVKNEEVPILSVQEIKTPKSLKEQYTIREPSLDMINDKTGENIDNLELPKITQSPQFLQRYISKTPQHENSKDLKIQFPPIQKQQLLQIQEAQQEQTPLNDNHQNSLKIHQFQNQNNNNNVEINNFSPRKSQLSKSKSSIKSQKQEKCQSLANIPLEEISIQYPVIQKSRRQSIYTKKAQFNIMANSQQNSHRKSSTIHIHKHEIKNEKQKSFLEFQKTQNKNLHQLKRMKSTLQLEKSKDKISRGNSFNHKSNNHSRKNSIYSKQPSNVSNKRQKQYLNDTGSNPDLIANFNIKNHRESHSKLQYQQSNHKELKDLKDLISINFFQTQQKQEQIIQHIKEKKQLLQQQLQIQGNIQQNQIQNMNISSKPNNKQQQQQQQNTPNHNHNQEMLLGQIIKQQDKEEDKYQEYLYYFPQFNIERTIKEYNYIIDTIKKQKFLLKKRISNKNASIQGTTIVNSSKNKLPSKIIKDQDQFLYNKSKTKRKSQVSPIIQQFIE